MQLLKENNPACFGILHPSAWHCRCSLITLPGEEDGQVLGEFDKVWIISESIYSERFCRGDKAELSLGIYMKLSIRRERKPLQSRKAAHFMWPSTLHLQENHPTSHWAWGLWNCAQLPVIGWSPWAPGGHGGGSGGCIELALSSPKPWVTTRAILCPAKLDLIGQVP